jgi:hypothetical protein
MVTTAEEHLETLTPIVDRVSRDPYNGIVIEFVLDSNRTQTSDRYLNDLLYGSWKEISVKNDLNLGTTYENEQSSTKEQSFVKSLQEKIFDKLSFPKHWLEEGISKPNFTARTNALRICEELYLKYNLDPDKILPTKEEGVYITYDTVSEYESRSLVIEAYNDAETALAICDKINKRILYSEDITDYDFSNAIKIFKETNC